MKCRIDQSKKKWLGMKIQKEKEKRSVTDAGLEPAISWSEVKRLTIRPAGLMSLKISVDALLLVASTAIFIVWIFKPIHSFLLYVEKMEMMFEWIVSFEHVAILGFVDTLFYGFCLSMRIHVTGIYIYNPITCRLFKTRQLNEPPWIIDTIWWLYRAKQRRNKKKKAR